MVRAALRAEGESGRLSRIHIPHPIPFITGTFYRHLKRGISAAKRSQCRINNSLPFTLFCKEKSAIIAIQQQLQHDMETWFQICRGKYHADHAKAENAGCAGPSGTTMLDALCRFQKGDDMKRLLLGMMAMMMLVMSGCGGGSVEVFVPLGPVISPPSITAYRFTQDQATEFIDGSVDFYAPDSDIDTMTVAVFDSGGSLISRTTTLINLQGVTGRIPFSIGYGNRAFLVDTLTLSVYLTDFNGLTSNVAVTTFLVP